MSVRRVERTPDIVTVDADYPSAEIITISPDMAAHWLARGGKNRKLNARRVDNLSAAIHRGEWRLTGDTIKLDAAGRVRDGQHRLQAIVKAQISAISLVVRGVGEDAFDVMDSGRSRTIGDVLGMHGYVSFNALAGAARLLFFAERFGDMFSSTRESERIITAVTTLQYIEQHSEIENGIRLGDRVRKAGLQGGASTWGALMTLFLRADAEKAYEFGHYLSTGEGLGKGHPALMLRNRLLWRRNGSSAVRAEGRKEMAAICIKAWNAFREGRTVQALWFRTEGPKPEVFPKAI